MPDVGNCWIWKLRLSINGYGFAHFMGKARIAHRVAFYLHNGRWPQPCCLHKCDNPSCVRPDHLFEGTNDDNVRDKVSKGRQARVRGTQNGNATLNDDLVRAIRRLRKEGKTGPQIAAQLGVSVTSTWDVMCGRKWRHVV